MNNELERLGEIAALVDRAGYFVINRARQYGKTTTLNLLAEKLEKRYAVFSISFEGMEDRICASPENFCRNFYGLLNDEFLYHEVKGITNVIREECERRSRDNSLQMGISGLSEFISYMCKEATRPIVLIIDEVDQASNYDIFITFLGMLRKKYLARRKQPTFHSIILAGVYDIKNMKLKIRKDAEHQYNSPWNIAADFTVDMSFSMEDIAGMLSEYERDTCTGMDIPDMAKLIYDYTSGYPFLVSRICKIMDEQIPRNGEFMDMSMIWTKEGFLKAVNILLAESNTLFDDMIKKLDDFPELSRILYSILFRGERVPYNVYNRVINLGVMFGFVKKSTDGESIAVANRIFETQLYNLFISDELIDSAIYKAASADRDRNWFIRDGKLDMEQVLERFVESFTDIYMGADEKFIEENGRRFFLLYLKPIIKWKADCDYGSD